MKTNDRIWHKKPNQEETKEVIKIRDLRKETLQRWKRGGRKECERKINERLDEEWIYFTETATCCE